MGITESAVSNPAGVTVAIAIIGLFGLICPPILLLPGAVLPQPAVRSKRRATSPPEAESELLAPNVRSPGDPQWFLSVGKSEVEL